MKNVLRNKSFLFAKRVVFCVKYLREKNEFVMSRQLLRSGTAIGALVREAEMAESKKDFIHKLYISLKEANETVYWIDLLTETNYLVSENGNSLKADCTELIKLLVASIKTSKTKKLMTTISSSQVSG